MNLYPYLTDTGVRISNLPMMRRGREGGGTETLLEAVPLGIRVKIVFVPAFSYNSKEEGDVGLRVCIEWVGLVTTT